MIPPDSLATSKKRPSLAPPAACSAADLRHDVASLEIVSPLLLSKETAVDVHLKLQFPAAVSSATETRRWSSTVSEPSVVITEPVSSWNRARTSILAAA